jgi:signal transduction histidine kinase
MSADPMGAGGSGSASVPEHPGLLPSGLLHDPLNDYGRPPKRSGRDWAVDVACFMVAFLGGLALFANQVQATSPSVALGTTDLACGLVACAALWWRRRWPVHLAVAISFVSAFSAMAAIAAIVMLFAVAVHRPFRVVAGVATLLLIAGLTYTAVRPDHEAPRTEKIVLTVLFAAIALAWGMFARARRQLVLSLRERAERAEAEQQLRVSQARHLERTRIAREMHDVLAHRISLISLHAGALEFRAAAVGEEVAESAAVIRSSAHEALEDLRTVIGILRTDGEDEGRPQPTLADVPGLVGESQRAGMHVELVFNVQEAAGAPLSLGRTAYRIIQEGLTNAHKHAPGAAVRVGLHGAPGSGIDVEVLSRAPIGAPVQPVIPGGGQGLIGLTERTDLAGGRLEHGAMRNGDFRLGAWLPWPERAAKQ